MRFFFTAIVVLILIVSGLLTLAYSGSVDVAAAKSHGGSVEWYLDTARRSSVEAGARNIHVPALDDPSLIRAGLVHYQETCVMCHGAPGVDRSEIGKGLDPKPPSLTTPSDLSEGSAARTYWIVKNGLRMTGMPAFGGTRSDREIWSIVAFVERMQNLSADGYAEMARSAGPPRESTVFARDKNMEVGRPDSPVPAEPDEGPGHGGPRR